MYKQYSFLILICIGYLSFVQIHYLYAYDSNTVLSDKDNSSISGIVKDKDTKETLIGASIMILGTKLGARTNKNGYFSITQIPSGTYKVIVSFLGYDKFEQSFTFKNDINIRKDFELSPNCRTSGRCISRS